ncbi:1-pyrroline-5-carboxylate dehydrogenase [Vibrio sp.]|nr:1-pyrroline-5-carboxylate dehydrogenase [Vibrio sp.]
MIYQVFSDAYSSWENWNLTDFNSRKEAVLSFSNALQNTNPAFASVFAYHLSSAEEVIAEPKLMPGPTGETNELYTAGRGVSLLIQDSIDAKSELAIIAQLTVALIAGNAVILASDDRELVSAIEDAFSHSMLPINLLQFAPLESAITLIQTDVRNVGFVGSKAQEIVVNREIAKRTGAIVGIVSETDLDMIPQAHDPRLVLRFITERTRTINITAVGGNATLLELGSGEH